MIVTVVEPLRAVASPPAAALAPAACPPDNSGSEATLGMAACDDEAPFESTEEVVMVACVFLSES